MQSDPITKVTAAGEIDPLKSLTKFLPEFFYIVTDYKVFIYCYIIYYIGNK